MDMNFLDQVMDYHGGVNHHAEVQRTSENEDLASVSKKTGEMGLDVAKELGYMVLDLAGTGVEFVLNTSTPEGTYFVYKPESKMFQAFEMQGVGNTLSCLPKGIYESTVVKLSSSDFSEFHKGFFSTELFLVPIPKMVSGLNNMKFSRIPIPSLKNLKGDLLNSVSPNGANALVPELAVVGVPVLSVTGVAAASSPIPSMLVLAYGRDPRRGNPFGRHQPLSSRRRAMGPEFYTGFLRPPQVPN